MHTVLFQSRWIYVLMQFGDEMKLHQWIELIPLTLQSNSFLVFHLWAVAQKRWAAGSQHSKNKEGMCHYSVVLHEEIHVTQSSLA